MAPHSSTVARKIPWMEEAGRLQSMGSLRVGHNWATSLSLSTLMHWRRKWQPTPVFLPGESQGRRSLVGCSPWGRTESDTTKATWQQHLTCKCYFFGNFSSILNSLYINISNIFLQWWWLFQLLSYVQLFRDPVDSSLPGSSVQAIILESVAISFTRGSSWPRYWTCGPALAGRFSTTETPG